MTLRLLILAVWLAACTGCGALSRSWLPGLVSSSAPSPSASSPSASSPSASTPTASSAPTSDSSPAEFPVLSPTIQPLAQPLPLPVANEPASAGRGAERAVQPVGYQQVESLPAPPEPIETPLGEATDAAVAWELPELEQLALANNPTLAEAYARMEAARGNWVQVGLRPNPVIGYSGQQLGSGGAAEQYGMVLGQQWIRGDKLQLNRAVAHEEIAIAERALEAQRRRVLTDVQLGYYEMLVAQERVNLNQQLVEITQQATEAAEALFRAKEVSQVDVIRSRLERQKNALDLKTARNQLQAVWSRLTAVLGTPDLPHRPLAGKLDEFLLDFERAEVLQRLLAESPELHQALFEVDRSRWAVARAYAGAVPDVDVQAVWQYDESTDSSNGNLVVTLPIPWRDYNQGRQLEAKQQLVAAERAVQRAELNLQFRLAAVFQRYASARDRVREYSRSEGILENAQQSFQLVRDGYNAGEFGYLDLLNAQQTYAETNLNYLDAVGELWAATVEIDGLLLKGSLTGGSSELARH